MWKDKYDQGGRLYMSGSIEIPREIVKRMAGAGDVLDGPTIARIKEYLMLGSPNSAIIELNDVSAVDQFAREKISDLKQIIKQEIASGHFG